MCEDLWANIRRRAKIFGQISADVRRSVVGKYQKTCEDLREVSDFFNGSLPQGQISSDMENMWANIRKCAKICGQILVLVRISVGQYQLMCEDPRANTCRSAKIYCGQISVDARRFVGQYQQISKDQWANCSRHAKICGKITVVLRSYVGKYQQ